MVEAPEELVDSWLADGLASNGDTAQEARDVSRAPVGVMELVPRHRVETVEHQAVRRRGSSASRSESPNRLKPNTARLIATPGAIASHGACSRNCMPAPRSMSPHAGVGSFTPRPRNDSDASRRMAWPRKALSMMRYGAITLGTTCRQAMRSGRTPTARAASMY